MQFIIALVAVIYFWDEIVKIANGILMVLQWAAYGLAAFLVIAAVVGFWTFLMSFTRSKEIHTILSEQPNTVDYAQPLKSQPSAVQLTAPTQSQVELPKPALRSAMVNRSASAALVIDEPWISKILRGEKTWEMRSKPTRKRELVGLVRKGSGRVYAVARIVDCRGPLDDSQVLDSFEKHRVPLERIGKWRYAYVLEDVVQLPRPVSYVHNKGAVVFVKLDEQTSRTISEQLAAI